MKLLILGALLFAGVVSEILPFIESVEAQDFYHRDSQPRRRGDYRRGYRDGADCTHLISRVADAICENEEGRSRRTNCTDIFRTATNDSHNFLINARINGGSAVSYMANEALNCQGNRERDFDRDIEMESSQWHERDERRQRERERRGRQDPDQE